MEVDAEFEAMVMETRCFFVQVDPKRWHFSMECCDVDVKEAM